MDEHTYLSMDATDMAASIQNKETTPSELVQASFRQMEKVNPSLNAVVHTRMEKAQQEADRLEKNCREGRNSFCGVPMLLKNISQSVAGEPLTSGSRLMQHIVADTDSNLVSKIRNAGFIITGHTNVPEFALKNITEPETDGPARNPWRTDHSPGGSSGGAAAAVAGGIVPVAGASDGGGSIRIPASFTGLFGLKPTRGRTPVGPGAGRQWQGAAIDFVLSRSVRDSAAMLDILQTVQPEAAFQTPLFPGTFTEAMKQPFARSLKIAYTTDSPVGTPVSEDAKTAVRKFVTWLEKEGHHVEEADNGIDGTMLMEHYYMMNSGEIAGLTRQLEHSLGRKLTYEDVEIETWLLNMAGQSVSAADFTQSLSAWDDAAMQMETMHQTYDLYVTPATAFPAPKVGELTMSPAEEKKMLEAINSAKPDERQAIIYDMFLPSLTYSPFSQLANLTGQPAVSLPVHMTEGRLPLGVQALASKGREDTLLKLAWQAERSDIWQGMEGNPLFVT